MVWAFPVPARRGVALKDSFNRRYIPGTSRPYQRGKHGGIDIGGGGLRCNAVESGVVERTGNVWGPYYGRQVLIKHRYRTSTGRVYYRWTFYAHLSVIAVKVGQRVTRGQRIGTTGSTGNTKGAHLHFEWHSTNKWTTGLLNPFRRLENARKASR